MNKPASKLIMPKHIWDGKKKEKQKKDIEKVPQPTGYRLVLFPLKLEGKTAGGVLLTDTAIEQASIATNICKVIAVGPDAYQDKDKFPKGEWCKKGDYVCYGKHSGQKIKYKGIRLILLFDDQIIMRVEHPKDLDPTFNLHAGSA